MGDDLEIIEAPGDPIGDKCDRCGKVMNPNVDGCLLHVKTNKLYCVACALEREGIPREEITPDLVECTRQEIDRTFPDIVIKGDAIPALLEETITANRFVQHEAETDAEFRQRILIETMFIARGMTGTRDDIRNVLSMTNGVRFAGIIDHPGEGAIEILIIGDGFNRQDLAAALFNCLPVPCATIGEHIEFYKESSYPVTIEYRWTEFKTPEDFVMWYVRKMDVQTATGADLDRLGERVGLTRRIEDGDFFAPGETNESFRGRLLEGKKGEDE